jgi:Adenine/guanine phosphoribosyltransferases and related PRPP-binding proteins
MSFNSYQRSELAMHQAGSELVESIRSAKTVKIMKDENTAYNFKLYPFGERGTFITPSLIREITDSLAASIPDNFPVYDYLVSPEPGGHTWGMLASYRLKKPINILRMRAEKFEQADIAILRETAYNENYIFFDAFQQRDTVLILDDVISSGFTIRTIIEQFCKMDVKIAGVQAILVKGECYKKLEDDYGIPVRFLAQA